MSSLLVEQTRPATDAIAAMNAALDEFTQAPLWSMSMRQVAALVVDVERLANRIDSLKVAVIGQA